FMLYTILAFDNMHNGLPIAWVLMSRAIVPDLTLWMRKLVVSAHCHMLEWKPNDFMVDDDRAEIVAIRENGFYRNFKLEQLENKSWMKSLCILDGDVKFSEFDIDVAWVKSQSKEDKYYKIYNVDHSFALCECMWAAQGHVCKHILKVADLRKRMGMELYFKRNVSFSSTTHASTH
ncbi:hypothetical protein KI387_012639, partial [Taxus chinensis]